MKILHILSSSIYSGAETVACEIIDSYCDKADMAYVSPDGIIREVLKGKGIKFLPIKKMNSAEIRRIIREYKPDIIHAHDFRASVVSALSSLRVPIISHLHNNSPWLRSINPYSLMFLFASKRINEIIGVSSSIKDEYIFNRYIERKFSVFANPIDTNSIKKKSKLYNVNEKYDLIFIGRLKDEKSPMRFIRIINQLTDKKPDIKAAIIGDGILKQDCIDEIERLHLNGKINMLGFLNNPYPYLLNSEILLMPSKWEGFGLAAVEAMSLGKPVLATKVGGLVNIVDNECGRLCIDDSEFVEEAYRMLTNNDYYTLMSDAAYKRALELDNKNEFKDNVSKLYSKNKEEI